MKELMKKLIAECLGTAFLVFIGCGAGMAVNNYVATAIAFGLAIVVLAYSVGNISGGHVNPAVSLGVLVAGKMSVKDFLGYVIAQVIGAIVGAGLLFAFFALCGGMDPVTHLLSLDATGSLCSNTWGAGYDGGFAPILGAILNEVVLTFIFVLVILFVTSEKHSAGKATGIIIGLSLLALHLAGMALTGCSVNPARSLGTAIFAAIEGNIAPLSMVWVYFVGPLAGAALAGLLFKGLNKEEAHPQAE